MIETYKMTGLSKARSVTCETQNGDIFWATWTGAQDRFDALFAYFKQGDNWTGEQKAVLEFNSIQDGEPIEAKCIDVIL